MPWGNDSAYCAQRVMSLYGAEPRQALQLIDTIEAIGAEPDFTCDYLRATVYSRSSLQQHDSAIAICTVLLEHDSLQADDPASLARRQNALSLLCNSYRMVRNYEPWFTTSTELAELCRSQGEEVEALRTDAERGYILSAIGRRAEGIAILDKTIAALDAPGSVNRLDACIIAIKRKINVVEAEGEWETEVQLAQQIRRKITHFRQHMADYADDSYRLPAASGRYPSYCDFTEAQACAFLTNAYAAGRRPDSCRHWLAIYETMPYSQTYGGRRIVIPTRLYLGQYEAVESVCAEEIQRMGTDTVNANYSDILRHYARIAEGRRQAEKACGYWRRHAAMEKTLNEQLQASTAHINAARYLAQEQQRQLEKQQAALRTWRVMMVAVTLIAVLLILFALRQVQQKREMDRKNRALAQQISEVIRLKSVTLEARERIRAEQAEALKAAESKPKPQPTPKPTAKPLRKPTPEEIKEMTNTELFEWLCNDIRDNRLYTDPAFDRQKLAERYGLSFAQIGATFARGSEYDSVADFIRDCRLEYACTLLTETDMKMNEVAYTAGFNRVTTFNHDFKARYSLTPGEFRRK